MILGQTRINRSVKWMILILGLTGSALPAAADETDAAKLYQKARKEIVAFRWDEALALFSGLIEDFPGSRYEDDAQFYIGYCLEKRGDSDPEAFLAFSDLIRRFPGSPRVQDAVVHQIIVAENLVRGKQETFRFFLLDKLDDENTVIRQQAALALGRLDDREALPVLESMFGDQDWGSEARVLASQITASRLPGKTEPESPARKPGALEFDIRTRKETPARTRTPREIWDDRTFFLTERHEHYRKLLRDDGKWTREDLIDFGMWTILPADRFAAYFALQGYDKKEWFRRYWTLQDPTPTTEENEALDEFYRRIAYAHKRYGETWNARQFQYLKDQYLREGWPRAPWDARGELYVKYGEPNHVAIGGWHKEEWQYDRYSIDFVATRYLTNIYQKALSPGPLSQALYAGQEEWVRANYILNPEFRYEHRYNRKPMKDLRVLITRGEGDHRGEVQIAYSVPPKHFSIQREHGEYAIRYLRHLLILDEAMHEVRRHETLRTVPGKNRKELADRDAIEERIPVLLPPGRYRVALRIEDVKANTLGLYVENVTVAAK
ncbi:MAG TPA: GWxTD domain-containing protein [bacterium]|nr:GWxTD domain-containing protein [bacterium]